MKLIQIFEYYKVDFFNWDDFRHNDSTKWTRNKFLRIRLFEKTYQFLDIVNRSFDKHRYKIFDLFYTVCGIYFWQVFANLIRQSDEL